jgi:hypothetical protein
MWIPRKSTGMLPTALQQMSLYKRLTDFHKYWNWGTHALDQNKSPVFDGSSTSLGGDGEFRAHNGSLAGQKKIFIPSGKGGGCVKSGPFKEYVPIYK